jgi:hypothetical protein
MMAPSHSNPDGEPSFVANECAIHTITLPEGSFAAIVQSQQGKTGGVSIIGVLDEDEVERHIALLRSAIVDAKAEDAKRLAAAKPEGSA